MVKERVRINEKVRITQIYVNKTKYTSWNILRQQHYSAAYLKMITMYLHDYMARHWDLERRSGEKLVTFV